MKLTLRDLVSAVALILIPACAVAQQPLADSGRLQDWRAIGSFKSAQGGVFRIDTIDPDGSLRGYHTGLDDKGFQKAWDQFVARPGRDGYPEYTVAGGTNQYLRMHACGSNLCATFY